MGHDVIPIAPHNLPISSIKDMATALADISNCTVRYGFYNKHQYDEDGCFLETIFGIITKQGPEVRVLLDDTGRTKSMIESQFCDAIELEFFVPDGHNQISSIQILKYAFVGSNKYDGRWWPFNHAFNGMAFELEDVTNYRRFIKEEVLKMGGTYCVYIDDCGPSCYGYDMPETLPMEHLLEKLHDDFGADFLHISQFMQHPPASEVQPIKYYKAFFDDFKDLL